MNPDPGQAELNQAVNEAMGSSIDLTRALEQYLMKYPGSPREAEIETSLYKTANDSNDNARIVLYGERLLSRPSDNELELLDRVARALLTSEDTTAAKKALAYGKRYEAAVANMRVRAPESHATAAQWADLADRALSRALNIEARATGYLGNPEEAVANAMRSWNLLPCAESAHEIARWTAKLGRDADAIEYYTDAVTIEDSRSSWADRDRDRKLASTLYVKLHGSSEGFGDVLVQAWDRAAAAVHAHMARYRAMDPNYGVSDIFAFQLPAVNGELESLPSSPAPALDMGGLKGKTLVVDFWATWCLPCIAQHPLIEHVEQAYAQSPDIVFLSVNADEEHDLVAPFLKKQNWEQHVYLEAGLASVLNVTALPTMFIVDPSGKIFSRMGGIEPEAFERILKARIEEARAVAAK